MTEGSGQRLFLPPYPSTMASPRISLRFLKKPRDTRAKECLILRKPVMVSISPRLCCSSSSRLSGNREDRARAGREVTGLHGVGEQGALLDGGARRGPLRTGTRGGGQWCLSWVPVSGHGREERCGLGKVLTALAKIDDEAPLHVGAAHQILCGLDGVDGLGAHLALFGAQPLTLAAEYAGRGKWRVRNEPWSSVDLLTDLRVPPHPLHSPAAIAREAWRALGQAAALVDAEGGGAAGHRAQAGTALRRDAAPGLVLVGAWGAGPVAGTLEIEVTTSDAGTRVFRPAAAPQAFDVAALTPSGAGQPMGTGTHCGQRAVSGLAPAPLVLVPPLPLG